MLRFWELSTGNFVAQYWVCVFKVASIAVARQGAASVTDRTGQEFLGPIGTVPASSLSAQISLHFSGVFVYFSPLLTFSSISPSPPMLMSEIQIHVKFSLWLFPRQMSYSRTVQIQLLVKWHHGARRLTGYIRKNPPNFQDNRNNHPNHPSSYDV